MLTKKQLALLVSRRLERGLTQAALAKKIGVSRVYVTHWENGRVPPTDHLKAWCRALGLKCRVRIEIE